MLAPTLFNLYFDIIIHMALAEHLDEGKGVEMMYLQGGKLVGNHRKLSQSVYSRSLIWSMQMT